MHPLHRLNSFDTLVYTVGDGSPLNDAHNVNALSRANAHQAAAMTLSTHDSVLFIAGGNSGEKGRRGDGIPGSLREAERMKKCIREMFGERVPLMTDCDPEFAELFPALEPSCNTIENARNAATVARAGMFDRISVVAERNHLPRVIGTLRKQLRDLDLLGNMEMDTLAVDAEFEPTNDQWHIRSKARFKLWTALSNAHHWATGNVIRGEYLKEALSGNRYKHLEKS